MAFLRFKDFAAQIQTDNLNQIIEEDLDVLTQAQEAAQTEIISYLAQRYKTDRVFFSLQTFDINQTYYGKNLVEYTADDYATGTTYSTGDRVVFNSTIYKSNSGSTSVSPALSGWTEIVADKTLYYAVTNANEYNPESSYSAGEQVWFEDVVYTALVTVAPGVYPLVSTSWSAGATYSFVGHYPEETDYWIQGDNRNKQILMYLIDCTLYHLHSRINPRLIPELRSIRYDGGNALQTGSAIGWLKKVASGELTAGLPEKYPIQGRTIRWGFNDLKDSNTY